MALLQNRHLKIGQLYLAIMLIFFNDPAKPVANKLVYCNHKDHDQKVFMLTSMDDVEATMVHKPILAPEVTIKVPHADLKLWKATKSKMPKMCDSKYVEVALPQKHHMILMEFQKVKVAMAYRQSWNWLPPWPAFSNKA